MSDTSARIYSRAFKELMKSALVDASSAIILYKVDFFHAMTTALNIIMTKSVFEEITRNGYDGAETFKTDYTGRQSFTVTSYKRKDREDTKKLARGERDTILLFLSGVADFIIIDDGKGARYCRDHKIPYINALLCPKVLYFSDIITEKKLQKITEQILLIGRYSQKIRNDAKRCGKQDLKHFLI